jgi:hypothetical protein
LKSLLTLFLLLLTFGCSSDKEQRSGTEVGDAARPHLSAVLASYEEVRALLAGDKIEGIAEAVRRIEVSAGAALPLVPATLQPTVRELIASTKPLQAPSNMPKARKDFGEMSRHVVTLLAAAPSLAEGKHVMECPMAEGYRKWVQNDATIDNPYMGSRMLRCGMESTWDHQYAQ